MKKLYFKTDSHQQIEELSLSTLKAAGVYGEIPTPLDAIVEHIKCEKIHGMEPIKQRFIARLSRTAAERFLSGIEKIRAIADLREKVIYIPETTHHSRVTFATAHEIGHQVIPWHRMENSSYSDTNKTLSPEIQELFEQQANQFGSDVIFQGKKFRRRSRIYEPSFDTILSLSQEFGASIHSTIWRFADESQDCLVVLPYRPTNMFDDEGNQKLKLYPVIPSTTFRMEFSEATFQEMVDSSYEWANTFYDREDRKGETILYNDRREKVVFEWESWTNTYTLFVLLKRKSKIIIPRKIIRLVSN